MASLANPPSPSENHYIDHRMLALGTSVAGGGAISGSHELDLEHIMNYVLSCSYRFGETDECFAPLVEEATTLTALALFIGMVAIWAQVIVTL